MSDQEHLSAEYMQSKAVSLLGRVGRSAMLLGNMSRLVKLLVSQTDLLKVTQQLADDGGMAARLESARDHFRLAMTRKMDPRSLALLGESLASTSSVQQAERSLREAQMLHESTLAQVQRRQQKAYDQALKRAGLVAEDASGALADEEALLAEREQQAEADAPPPPSVVATLIEADTGLGDLKTLQLALAHLEAMAPAEWNLDGRAAAEGRTPAAAIGPTRATKAELRLAELGDELSALRQRKQQQDSMREALAREIAFFEPELEPEREGESVADGVRRRLDTLRQDAEHLARTGPLAQSRATLEEMEAAHAEALRLAHQFERATTKLKKICAKRGIDLDQLMLEQNVATAAAAAARGDTQDDMAPAGAFTVGGTRTPSFAVQFAPDGSGRLLAVRQSSALATLGFQSSSGALEEGGGPDSPRFAGADERLAWCAAQLAHLRQRMDTRFERLGVSTASWARERTLGSTTLKQVRSSLLPCLRQLQAFAQGDAHRVGRFREEIGRQLRAITEADQRWKQKEAYYGRVHGEAIVLLQRMGEEADAILR